MSAGDGKDPRFPDGYPGYPPPPPASYPPPAYPVANPGYPQSSYPPHPQQVPYPGQSYSQPYGYYPPKPWPPAKAEDPYKNLVDLDRIDICGDQALAGLFERAPASTDIQQPHDILGRLDTGTDMEPKLALIAPFMIISPVAGVPAGRASLVICGRTERKLGAAMLSAGRKPADGPEAASTITVTWSGEGSYDIGYVSPSAKSRQLLQAQLAIWDMSPIEKQFWAAHQRLQLPELDGLVPQHVTGAYRIDFALPDRMIGIELDGFESHSSTADIARDRSRQRELELSGWRIIRFGGSEVHHDADECVRQAAHLADVIREG